MSFHYINVETIGKLKNYFPFQIRKKCTSPANEFLSHECRNKNKKNVFFLFLFNPRKSTSPANEPLPHKCRNKNDFFFLLNPRKSTSPDNEPLPHKCRNKNDSFFSNPRKKIYKSS